MFSKVAVRPIFSNDNILGSERRSPERLDGCMLLIRVGSQLHDASLYLAEIKIGRSMDRSRVIAQRNVNRGVEKLLSYQMTAILDG
jgi:hypothetical protein